MAMEVNELYKPIQVGVNATVTLDCRRLGCFVAATAGNIAISDNSSAVILPSTPVVAGGVLPLPFLCNGGQIVASGGASGVIGVA